MATAHILHLRLLSGWGRISNPHKPMRTDRPHCMLYECHRVTRVQHTWCPLPKDDSIRRNKGVYAYCLFPCGRQGAFGADKEVFTCVHGFYLLHLALAELLIVGDRTYWWWPGTVFSGQRSAVAMSIKEVLIDVRHSWKPLGVAVWVTAGHEHLDLLLVILWVRTNCSLHLTDVHYSLPRNTSPTPTLITVPSPNRPPRTCLWLL